MSNKFRNKNGFFISQKSAVRKNKALEAMSNAKKKCIKEVIEKYQVNDTCDELRIVNLKELARNMKCRECKRVLDLGEVSKERLIGCHSVLTILCDSCNIFTQVNTAKIIKNDISEVNAG